MDQKDKENKVNETIDRFMGIPFSLDLLDDFDFETKRFVDGPLLGFGMDVNKNNCVVVKYSNPNGGEVSVKIDEDYYKNHKAISTQDILKHFISLLSDVCVERIYDSAIKKQRKPEEQRSTFKFNKTSLPPEVCIMPKLFYFQSFTTKKQTINIDTATGHHTESLPITTRTVLDELKLSVSNDLLAKERQKSFHTDRETMDDLGSLIYDAQISFMKALDKQVRNVSKEK